ncbi:MAG: pyridoxal 5'-phosphate synthase glutaminase subunit PdxT [bacterium TMED264]|nr:MAG: pyridoxal 5'-phosphate synthase glutaminase subunit PdxT [bacterium TMED264]
MAGKGLVIKIGVLELQGGYALHHNLLRKIGLSSLSVKSSIELNESKGLIIPGGESTTISLLMKKYNLRESIIKFAKHNPVMGTCAGLIVMSKDVDDERVEPLGLFDLSISRNAYGRQIDSSKKKIYFQYNQKKNIELHSTFIRAPKIKYIGENINIIAKQDDLPVAIFSRNLLGLSFHPEIDGIDIFHRMMFDKSSKFYYKN